MPEHQTVAWVIDQLKQYPPDTRVEFQTGYFDPSKYWASDYLNDDGVLCVDIEEGGI